MEHRSEEEDYGGTTFDISTSDSELLRGEPGQREWNSLNDKERGGNRKRKNWIIQKQSNTIVIEDKRLVKANSLEIEKNRYPVASAEGGELRILARSFMLKFLRAKISSKQRFLEGVKLHHTSENALWTALESRAVAEGFLTLD